MLNILNIYCTCCFSSSRIQIGHKDRTEKINEDGMRKRNARKIRAVSHVCLNPSPERLHLTLLSSNQHTDPLIINRSCIDCLLSRGSDEPIVTLTLMARECAMPDGSFSSQRPLFGCTHEP